MSSPVAQQSTRTGRPRRFDSDTERGLLLDAAVKVMTQVDYADVAVSHVLAEAGVSTRAFYRHFSSKEELLIALMRRDAHEVGELLDRAVTRAVDPAAAVGAWLDGYLAVFYDVKRARRTRLYASPAVRTSVAVSAWHAEGRQIVARPLVRALREGTASGLLHSPDPEADAMSLLALVSAAAAPPRRLPTRRAAREHVNRYAWPALGLSTGERD